MNHPNAGRATERRVDIEQSMTSRTAEKIVQSYVYADDKKFFVSTIYRQSSVAVSSPPWFYEIYGWELNDKNEKGEWIIEDSANNFPEAMEKHNKHCIKLLEKHRSV